jgi:hypothetical protein
MTATIHDDTDCDHCGSKATRRTCEGCGVTALITDCGHLDQPRPIAPYGIYGHNCSCDDCEAGS